MVKYEVVLAKYPNLDHPDNLWWTAICPTMRGCVSDGQTREEALLMIADAMALYPEPGTSWEVVVLEGAQAEKETVLAECHEEGGVTEVHRVEPRFMTEEEIRRYDRHLDPAESPIV